MSPLNGKALAAIALLSDRRENWSVIKYGDLAKRIGHPAHFLGDVLDRVGAWCYEQNIQSLALLVINDHNGRPSPGLFKNIFRKDDPVTEENYEERRLLLWNENWTKIILPTDPQDIERSFLAQTGK
jgi:hypothetical protein